MLLLPYRSKSKPESFPFATIAIIVLNVFVYTLTTESLLSVREDALTGYAMSHATVSTQPFRLITAMFLHGGLTHLIGNMLFLAVFGPAAEGRLRTARFVALYFLAGIVGGLFENFVTGFGAPEQYSIGASGAIMGVMGMYLWMFPHSKIRVFFLAGLAVKNLEWKAKWLCAFFIFFDLWDGFLVSKDGIGHLCHLAGAAVGWAAVMFLNVKADTADETKVQEMLSESFNNIRSLSLMELAFAFDACPDNAEVAMAYVVRAADDGARRRAVEAMQKREELLIAKGNPTELAYILLALGDYDGVPPPWLMLRVASRLLYTEPGLAESLLRKVLSARKRPEGELLELALVRLADLIKSKPLLREEAAALYAAVVERFPLSESASRARDGLRELGLPSALVFSPDEGKVVSVHKAQASYVTQAA